MVAVVNKPEALRDMFAAITEQTFQVDLGIADTRLTDYLTDLLLRFVRLDVIHRFRNTLGRRLEDVTCSLCGPRRDERATTRFSLCVSSRTADKREQGQSGERPLRYRNDELLSRMRRRKADDFHVHGSRCPAAPMHPSISQSVPRERVAESN